MENILVAVDNSPYLEKILAYLKKIFNGRCDVSLYFFHIKRPCLVFDELLTEDVDRDLILQKIEALKRDKAKCKLETQKIVEHIKEKVFSLFSDKREKPQIFFDAIEESGDYAQMILNKARSINASTIVVGKKGDSIVSEYLIGSTADKLAKISKGFTIWLIE